MSRGGQDTERHREWPWERPHAELEHLERVELKLLIAIGRAIGELEATQRTMSRHLAAIEHKEARIMADLTALTAALEEVKASAEVASEAVLAALAATSAQIADLRAQIDALTVGAVTQDQIDALAVTARDADAIVDSITAAVTPPTP